MRVVSAWRSTRQGRRARDEGVRDEAHLVRLGSRARAALNRGRQPDRETKKPSISTTIRLHHPCSSSAPGETGRESGQDGGKKRRNLRPSERVVQDNKIKADRQTDRPCTRLLNELLQG